ncbi:hypothetical protein SAMN05421770_10859 [Granulicella rosea]|uniref:BrnA antitoxin of type II toxin-antitoxin system n=1 Tax=Granulicella rosea TaxID=474952 RepID=A0A239LZJ3_9BACT|nr:hypothetical protein [Granulicella rosea]SNT35203.1 hypothetical protein SAMN05421770_10859 [Granulicella rosea]
MTLKTDPFADLADFAPKPKPAVAPKPAPIPVAPAPALVNEAAGLTILAEKHGFSINNLEEQRRTFRGRRSSRAPKTMPITMRVRVADWNRFQEFCELNEYTVAEGFELLARMIPQAEGPPK